MASDWIRDLLDALDEIATEHSPYECGLPVNGSVGDALRAAVQQCSDRQLAAERARVVGLVTAAEQMLRYVAGDSAIQMTDAVHDLAAAVNRIKEASRGES